MKLIFTYIILLSTLSCNSGIKNGENANSDSTKSNPQKSPINCYRYIGAGDTITLKLVHIGQSITGTLVYLFEKKESIKGTIQGNMHGDTLLANYNIFSNDQGSKRVAFKLIDSSFIQGYSKDQNENNKRFYSNVDSIKFNEEMKLVEIPCE